MRKAQEYDQNNILITKARNKDITLKATIERKKNMKMRT